MRSEFPLVNVKGKWCLITGASRGIGYNIAILMAKQGANLILQSRSKEHTANVLSEVKSLGVQAFAVEAELSSMESVHTMLSEIDESGVNVEIVFNNAAVQIAYRTDYFKTPVSDYTESFNINTIAPMMICYHFIPKMIEQGFGRVINVTSGIKNEPEQAGYSASKAALDKVTTDIGSKLDGTDVMISLTDPGWCRTDLGGPNAPNSPESAVPGICVAAFVDDKKSGRLFPAQMFTGMELADAVSKAEAEL